MVTKYSRQQLLPLIGKSITVKHRRVAPGGRGETEPFELTSILVDVGEWHMFLRRKARGLSGAGYSAIKLDAILDVTWTETVTKSLDDEG